MRIESARITRTVVRQEDFPRDRLAQIAFVGRSNVGKSSLLNRLLGRKALARTSSTPGKTRAINFFLVNERFYFVDLPGYGYAKVGKKERRDWARLMEMYFQETLPGAQFIQLVDAKVGATVLDAQANEYLRHLGCTPTVVATKIDRISRNRRAATLGGVRRDLELDEGASLLGVSSRTGEGVKQLWVEIESYLRTLENA